MIFLKRNIPLLICFICGVIFALRNYFTSPFFQSLGNQGASSAIIIQALALLFGCVYITVHHIDKIRRKEKGLGFSFILLATLFITFIAGIFANAEPLSTEGNLTLFGWIYKYGFNPLQATMFSLLGFYIASAAFRAFNINDFLGVILFLATTIVILGQVPIINDLYLSIFGKDATSPSAIVDWIIQNPVMTAMRAILIGITFGIIVTSLKTILGIDRGWLGKE